MVRAFSMAFFASFLCSSVQAGVVVTLVPSAPGDYQAGQVITVDVLARIETATVAPVPGAPGARLRLAQFDTGASDSALGIAQAVTHTGIGEEPPFGEIQFWNFGTTSNCTGNPAACGENYFISSVGDVLNATYTGLTSNAARQIALTTTDKVVGVLQITMPDVNGTYLLDVLNAQATGEAGSKFQYGFGTGTDPTVNFSAAAGTVTGGQARFNVVPEPATLAMLGLGGLAAAFRRRRSA